MIQLPKILILKKMFLRFEDNFVLQYYSSKTPPNLIINQNKIYIHTKLNIYT